MVMAFIVFLFNSLLIRYKRFRWEQSQKIEYQQRKLYYSGAKRTQLGMLVILRSIAQYKITPLLLLACLNCCTYNMYVKLVLT